LNRDPAAHSDIDKVAGKLPSMILNCIQLHPWPAFLTLFLLIPLFSQAVININSTHDREDTVKGLSGFHFQPGPNILSPQEIRFCQGGDKQIFLYVD
jgi:hypothetical protein